MADFPYLGNRISLISSSEIRYEGILYTIDTVHGTVTLAQVRSYGTEDRPTERPVAERDEIYDFIVFRGSDIKDIKLCNVRKTYEDPAIVEMGSSTAGGSSLPPPSAVVGGPTSATTPHFGVQNPASALHHSTAANADSFAQRPAEQTSLAGQQMTSHHRVADVSNSSSPTSHRNKSPTSDQGVQTAGAVINTASGATTGGGSHSQYNVPPPYHQHDNRYNHRFNNERSRGGGGGGNFRGHRGGGGMMRRGRAGGPANHQPRAPPPIKFDEDFDFEEANKKFAELADQLSKAKISDGDEATAGRDNSSSPNIDENGADNSNGDSVSADSNTATASKTEQDSVCYDKKKSFFDTISCDSTARDQRRGDWQMERRQNLETFGVEGTRRGFRRGGGYYGNNRGGGGGGYYGNRGGSGGWRGNGYRNYNNNYGRGGGGGYYNQRNNNSNGYNNGYRNNNNMGGYNRSSYNNNNYRGYRRNSRADENQHDNCTAVKLQPVHS